MKEPVSKFNMEAAFKALDEIDVPKVSGGIIPNRVNLKESMRIAPQTDILFEEYYDLNSGEDVDAAKEEREAEVAKAKLARIEKIVDLDAETEEDILPSYEGKMIMQCPQCMTLFYKNPEDIEYSEENPDVVNINEVCQHCGNTSGYTLVGKVAKVGEDEADKYDTDEVDDILDAKEEADAGQEQPTEEPAQEEAPAEENTEELPELPELPAEEEEEKEETNESLKESFKITEPVMLDSNDLDNLIDEDMVIICDAKDEAEVRRLAKKACDTVDDVADNTSEEPSFSAFELFDSYMTKADIEYEYLDVSFAEDMDESLKESVVEKETDQLCSITRDGKQIYSGTKEECEKFFNNLKNTAAYKARPEGYKLLNTAKTVVKEAIEQGASSNDVDDTNYRPGFCVEYGGIEAFYYTDEKKARADYAQALADFDELDSDCSGITLWKLGATEDDDVVLDTKTNESLKEAIDEEKLYITSFNKDGIVLINYLGNSLKDAKKAYRKLAKETSHYGYEEEDGCLISYISKADADILLDGQDIIGTGEELEITNEAQEKILDKIAYNYIDESLKEAVVEKETDQLCSVTCAGTQIYVGTKEECEKFLDNCKQSASFDPDKYKILDTAIVNVKTKDESLNNSEFQKEAAKNSELATENKSENLTLNEGIEVEVDLADAYEPWQGAVDTWEKIKEADKIEAFEDYLNELYPDGGLTLTQINDMLWFDGDKVLADLGLAEEPVEESLNEAADDTLPELTASNIDKLMNSDEFKTPISEEEVEQYLEQLNKMTEACKNSECENKPLKECDKKPLQEAEEDEAAEEDAAEDAPEAQEEAEVVEVEETPAEEETAEDKANIEAKENAEADNATFTTEEVKDIAETVATEVAHMTTEIETGKTEADGEILDRANDYADSAVEKAVEEKADETPTEEAEVEENEAEVEDGEIKAEAEEEATEDDEEVVALLGDIDDASIEECLNKSLQEVYSNVENFKLNSKAINEEKDLVVEGTINFKSGKQKATRYIFNECVCDETPDAVIIELKGINNDLADDGVFVLNCKGCKDAPMMAESFSYNYHIGETLVEGLIK